MLTAIAKLKSTAPFSFSGFVDPDSQEGEARRRDNESFPEWDKRIAPMRAEYTNDGHVIIHAMRFKKSIEAAAKYLGDKIPGRGNSNYTKHFLAGIQVEGGIRCAETRKTIECKPFMCSSTGKRGADAGAKVIRHYPMIPKWAGEITFYVSDTVITQGIFRRHLEAAGLFVGVGRWRPECGGCNGRFKVVSIKFTDKG